MRTKRRSDLSDEKLSETMTFTEWAWHVGGDKYLTQSEG